MNNISPSMIYWITRLDYFQYAAFSIAGILCVGGLLFIFAAFSDWDDTLGKKFKFPSISISLFSFGIIILISSLFIPTTKEAAAIYIIPELSYNQTIQKTPDRIEKLISHYMVKLGLEDE